MRRALALLALLPLTACVTTPDGKTHLLRAGDILYVGSTAIRHAGQPAAETPPSEQATPVGESPATE